MKKRLTIYDIKRAINKTGSHFFDRETMRFFGQTLKDFKVHKQKDGRYLISAPMRRLGEVCGKTEWYYNPEKIALKKNKRQQHKPLWPALRGLWW